MTPPVFLLFPAIPGARITAFSFLLDRKDPEAPRPKPARPPKRG